MPVRTILLGLILTPVMIGCAGDPLPLYRPFERRAGYSEVQVAPDRYQVTYQGTPGMSDGAAAELAKLRAAELARLLSRSHIRIVDLRMGGRTYTEYEPAWWTTDSFVDRDGHRHYHQRLLREGYYDSYSVPVTVMVVELLDSPAPDALSAQEVWEQAVATKLVGPP